MAKAPRSTLCIPCVYALLPDKSKATYLILFNKLKELDMSGPTVAHMDYETADKTGGVRHTLEEKLAQEPD